MEEAFLSALEQVRRRFQMCVFGYVVMPEHVHLLVNEPASATIANVMYSLKRNVSDRLRRERKAEAGDQPFWQARYFDHNVRNHAGFVTQLRYIHRNPVKRGLCKVPEEWPCSNFRAWATGEIGPAEIENQWTAARREARRFSSPAFATEKVAKTGHGIFR